MCVLCSKKKYFNENTTKFGISFLSRVRDIYSFNL